MKKSLLLAVAIISVNAIAGCANLANSTQSSTPAVDAPSAQIAQNGENVISAQPFDYQDYAEVLQTYVDENGLVDYQGLQANRGQLDRFNQSLGAVTPETYASWSAVEQIAFLTNAYNSLTLQSIIDRDPLPESIRDIPGVWKRRKFNVAGKEMTLDNIEHDTLRKDFNEPRVHVALVCAAISCPPLRNEPYLPEELDAQLDDQTAKFASSPQGLSIDQEDKQVYLSSIFKWYGQDYEPTYGVKDQFKGNDKQRAVLNQFIPFLDSANQNFLKQEDYKVRYLDYDWSLNQQ